MVSRYKYYANLLEGYVNTSAIVPLSQNIPTTVLEYHRKTEPNLINFDKQNFLDPYQENHLIEQPSSEAVYMQFTGSLAKPDDDTPDLKSFRMVSQNHKSIIKEEDLEKPFPVTFTASENW